MENVWLRKDKGGTSIGPHSWPEDGSVCEVPPQLAADLLADPEWGYSLADPPEPESAVEAGAQDKPKTSRQRKPAAKSET